MIILIHQLLYLSLGIQTFAAELVIWYQSQVAVVLDCAPGDIQKHRNLLVCQKTYAAEYRVMAVADNPDGFKRLPCLFSCRDNPRIGFINYLVSHWQRHWVKHRSAPDSR